MLILARIELTNLQICWIAAILWILVQLVSNLLGSIELWVGN